MRPNNTNLAHPYYKPCFMKGASMPCVVDGVRYFSPTEAALTIGELPTSLNSALAHGQSKFKGHSIGWAEPESKYINGKRR